VRNLLRPAAYVLFVLALAALFANVEIQVEGASGWAGSLPTWRRTPEEWPILRLIWGGRPMTGYHFYVFPFMALIFHLPILFSWRWSIALEARCLGSIMVFWIVEDVLWFVLNPAFDMREFAPGKVPWHPHWVLGLPADYWVFGLLGLGLLAFSFARGEKRSS
jgi:hypothetical protein